MMRIPTDLASLAIVFALLPLWAQGCLRINLEGGVRGDASTASEIGIDAGDAGALDAAPGDGIRETSAGDGALLDGPRPDSQVLQPKWIPIAAGTFNMGALPSDTCAYSNETLHQVTLTNKFEMMHTEVTQAQFNGQMGYNPSIFNTCGPNCPVGMVSWHEAVAYCNGLSIKKGYKPCFSCTGKTTNVGCTVATDYVGANIYSCPGYRLPTEAEWEYAYRAGTKTVYHNGPHATSMCQACSKKETAADQIAWYCANSGSRSHEVAMKLPNAWGLYDMAGNMWEWTYDTYKSDLGAAAVTDPVTTDASSYRMLRGGSWFYPPVLLRGSFRGRDVSTYRLLLFGFRCARTLP